MSQAVFELAGKIIYIVLYPYWAWYLRGTERARVAVISGDHVLLVKPWLGLGGWDLPGGGANKGENLAKTASRELLEETNIRVDTNKIELLDTGQVSKGLIRFTAHYYFVRSDAKTLPKPHRPEIAQARWVSKGEVGSLRVSKEVLGLIERCLEK